MRAIGVLAVACACACSYHPRALTSDAPAGAADASADAMPGVDGAVDAPVDAMITNCVLETDDAGLDNSGQAGDTGGGTGASIQCDQPSDVIVGISVAISNAVIFYGGRSALSIDITCAPVTVRSNGTAMVGTTYTHEITGNGAQSWSPATPSSVAMCPADSVVNGLDVHTGGGHLFQNVTISCAQIDSAGNPTGSTTPVYVMGSLTDTNGDDPVTCMAGHVLRRFDSLTGSGLDAVTLRCAPIRCAP